MRITLLAFALLAACSDGGTDTPGDGGGADGGNDGGGAQDGGASDGGGTGDGGSADGGATDGGGDGGGSGDGGAGDLEWEDVTPPGGPAACTGTLLHASTSAMSEDGLIRLEIAMPEGRGFHVDAAAVDPANYPLVYQLYAPSGRSVLLASGWWSKTELLTAAIWPEFQSMSFTWPIRAEDPAYEAGDWTVILGVADSGGSWVDGAEVDIDLYVTQDDDLDNGCVFVDVITSDGIAADTGLMTRLGDAVDRFAEVFASYGLTVVADWGEATLGDDLVAPATGRSAYRSLAEASGAHSMVVVIGETIDRSNTILGQAGNIPGALAPDDRGLVAASWLLHAGGDGRLSAAEAGFMGETLAHETGHYLGLFHPIEINADDTVTWTDALDDTPTCSKGSGDCTTLLKENLMFPYAMCMSGWCEAQDDLTSDQAGVLHRSARSL